MKNIDIDTIRTMSESIRKNIIEVSYKSKNSAHIGGSLSMVDILSTLYGAVLNYNVQCPSDKNRDRFILSKGHGALALYCTLYEIGFINDIQLNSYMQNGSDFIAHPIMNLQYGIESSNGSLGHGLSLAVGICLAAKLKNADYRTFVLLGDGECNEGSVWEAVMAASNFNLGNLVVVIDRNKMQNDGNSSNILQYHSFEDMWRSSGWDTKVVNGHDINALYQAFQLHEDPKTPRVVIANTIKGYGIPFMENNSAWHHGKLTDNLYTEAIEALNSRGNN